ncbi:hypothetical protein TNCV_1638651 [Trichonephila clavipes]|nr:hypothetical protein TNCV_1638651 [Trichonephila clavipes]
MLTYSLANRRAPMTVRTPAGSDLDLSDGTKRKLDLTGASDMNRLYPNSRRESIKEDKYLNTLPRRGGGWRKKRPNENETKLGWKMNGDCKTKLAAGTVVEIEAGASLFTDPISDFDEEVLHSFNCVLEIDTLGERRRVICEKTCTDRVVLWKVICENVVKIRG